MIEISSCIWITRCEDCEYCTPHMIMGMASKTCEHPTARHILHWEEGIPYWCPLIRDSEVMKREDSNSEGK